MQLITLEQIKKICPFAPKNIDAFVPHLNDTMAKYEINTKSRIAAFIAQVAHESGSFRYTRELGSGQYFEKYDTGKIAARLGNTPGADGDGAFYKGRGLIQCTGRDNYQKMSIALFGDLRLLQSPQLLETPQYAALSAGCFWAMHKLNAIADLPDTWRSEHGYTPFQYITFVINGGLNGYPERLAYYQRALATVS